MHRSMYALMPATAQFLVVGPASDARRWMFSKMYVVHRQMIARFGKKLYMKSIRGDAAHGTHSMKYDATSSAIPLCRSRHARYAAHGTVMMPAHHTAGFAMLTISPTI